MSLTVKLFEIQSAGLELRKDSRNDHFGNTYATLGAVLDVILPELTTRNILLTQAPRYTEFGPALTTEFLDQEDGSVIGFDTPLILDKATMQGLGSAITYARRYALVSYFNMDAEDDDGNEASGIKASGAETAKPRRTTPARRGR